MKTAYVYLNWYIAQLREDKLTSPQKNRLKELRRQVEASLNPCGEEKMADTHQLWQQLGQLEKELGIIASALDMPPPPSVFCGIEPMTSTQLSVRPPKRVPNLKKDEVLTTTNQQELINHLATKQAEEFDPDED